jgi:hypothetical protein
MKWRLRKFWVKVQVVYGRILSWLFWKRAPELLVEIVPPSTILVKIVKGRSIVNVQSPKTLSGNILMVSGDILTIGNKQNDAK